ncbi:MAG: helix-turn-helix domain-containing protein [Bacteroides sp.]|nr:helix-turn-helix domain-containing protein [Bacteroides sp.]
MAISDNILDEVFSYTLENEEDIAEKIARDMRCRRVERNISREMLAKESGVALANIVRFENYHLISLQNLIKIAMCLGYSAEMKNLFVQQKYDTLEELEIIKQNMNKKRARK